MNGASAKFLAAALAACTSFCCAAAARPPSDTPTPSSASSPGAAAGVGLTSYSGTGCVEMALVRSVSLDALRAMVPARHKLSPGADGAGQLSTALYSCDGVGIDDGPRTRAVIGEIGIRIESPDGTPGRHSYLLYHVTDLKPLAEVLGKLSDRFRYAPAASFSVGQRAPGAENTARGSIESDGVAFSIIGDPVKEPAASPVAHDAKGVTFWVDSPRGQIRVDYRAPQILPRSTGALTVKFMRADSALQQFGETGSGTGAFLRFDSKVLVNVVPL